MARTNLIFKTVLKFLTLSDPAFSISFVTERSQSFGNGLKKFAVRTILVLTAILFINANTWGQTTRYWVGGANASFAVAASWSTTLGGAGNGAPVAGDILIVDGSDISSVAGAQTGAVTINTLSTITLSSFTLQNSADVTLTAAAGRTLTLGNGTGNDLVIQSGSALNISTNVSVTMAISSTGLIDGTLLIGALRTFNSNNAGTLTTVNGSESGLPAPQTSRAFAVT